MAFTVVHAEDVNGNDVIGNVAIDVSGIQYDTTPLTPEKVFSQYASQTPGTFNMNRVKGTLKIAGANGNKNVVANIVINAKVVERMSLVFLIKFQHYFKTSINKIYTILRLY